MNPLDATEETRIMKKFLAMILALLMVVSCTAAAEELPPAENLPNAEELYTQLVVGNTTALSGGFFTEMWGNNTSDMDVRMLLHGYNLMEWNSAIGAYSINSAVVSGLAVMDDDAGNRTYTLSLYNDLFYSDGTPITAYDYAFSILLSIAPQVAALGGQTVGSDYIVGIDAYKSGESDVLTGVRVLDNDMLSLTVKAEYRPFFYELALLDYNPYPIHVIAPGCQVADTGDGVAIRNADETVEEPIFTADLLRETIMDKDTGYRSHPSVVSGPYTLVSFDWETRTAEFAINPFFKGDSAGNKPTIPTLILRTVSNDAMIEELKAGEVDLLNKCVSADVIAEGTALIAEAPVSMANYTRSGFSFMSFSCERPTVSSQAVRQAIAYCFDQNTMVQEYVGNYGLAVHGYYGLGQWMFQLVNGTVPAPVDELAENATAEETAAYEEAVAAWEALNLDGIPTYDLNIDAAKQLLVDDGWTLNRQGETFDEEKDDVRCKQVNGELVALDLTMIYPEGSALADSIDATLIANLAQAGIKLTAEPKPSNELLDIYYRNVARECDMIYLASNFNTVFEPSAAFNPAEAYVGSTNRTGIVDQELYELAVAMRQTEPGDVLAYCQKWVAFQERWAEVLPAIPVYSNVYFDFYTSALHNYNVSANMTWAQAIVGAYLSDVMEEDVGEEALEFEE